MAFFRLFVKAQLSAIFEKSTLPQSASNLPIAVYRSPLHSEKSKKRGGGL